MMQRPPILYSSFYYVALASAFGSGFFIFNNFLIHLLGWPGAYSGLAAIGVIDGSDIPAAGLTGFLQLAGFLIAFLLPAYLTYKLTTDGFEGRLEISEARLRNGASYVVSFAFWSVMFVGAADAIISFMRIEGFLEPLIGKELTANLGRSVWRGSFVHLPLMVLSGVIAARYRGIHFIWLATLIVVAELLIVVARFIFSYEQAFMGDLVRFWYAALFLFASAQTLIEEGHVRVDVVYASLSERTKSWVNVIGAAALGAPLCWTILMRGLWEKTSVINSPLLNFETSQSGFGMYVKYLMAGFLIIFAFSMLLQFSGVIMSHLRRLIGEPADNGTNQ